MLGTAWRTAQAEVNQFYDPQYAGRDGDRWYWAKLARPDSASGAYPLTIEAPLTSGPAATLTVWLQAYTASSSQTPDHLVQISINGTYLGAVSWDGKTAYIATLTVPAHLLQNGQNQVQLSLPGLPDVFVEGVWLDALALRYPTNQAGTGQLHFEGEAGQKSYVLSNWTTGLSLYDVTDPHQPLRLTGYNLIDGVLTLGDHSLDPARYLVVPTPHIKNPLLLQPAQAVIDPAGGADYVIITPPGLANAIAPLAAYRAAQGLRVTTVDVEAIYDAYGEGRMDPEAIRRFLQHAYQTWPAPAPLYVLLVGDGSYDFKNYSGFNPQTLLPPYLAEVDPWWGETAADNRLVTLSGNDPLPDMLIGRLAVNSPAETTTVVNKIIQYETNPPPGAWNRQHLFVTDNPDFASDFHQDSDQGYQALAGALQGHRFYYSDTPDDQPHIYTDISILQARFIEAFNNGASLVTYHGHSSWHQWAAESVFHLDDASQFNNQGRLPVVLQMTCFTGFFHHPEYPTLDESLVRQAGGGSVAVWASTGLGVGTGHVNLQNGFYQAVMQQGQTNLGAATLAGKMHLYAAGFYLDLIDTYTLFGDPAMTLSSVLKPDVAVTQQVSPQKPNPGETISLTLTVQNIGIGTAHNVRLTDILPLTILSPSWSASDVAVTLTGDTYRWRLPDLEPASTIVLTISGAIDPNLPTGFAIINTATVTSDSPELNLDNNSSTLIIGGQRVYVPIASRAR